MEHYGLTPMIKIGTSSTAYVPLAPTFSLRQHLFGSPRSSFTAVSAIDHDVRTFRRGGVASHGMTMKHDVNPLLKKVAVSVQPRAGREHSEPMDPVSASRRCALGSALTLVLGTFAFDPKKAFAQIPQMTLEEAVKPRELRKTVAEPIDASKLQGSYFDQFFQGIKWKGQMIKYDAKDASVHSHAVSERMMSMVNNQIEATAQFSNAEVEVKNLLCSGTTTEHGKTYVKPSGDMLCLSTDTLIESSKPVLHFDKVMISPEDPLTRIILTPIYTSSEGGNYELTNILFSRENADGSTTKIAMEDTWGLPVGHDMGLPIRGKWTKAVETINADYIVNSVSADYDRVAIPVYQDTYDRRVFALANEVIVALPTTIGTASKGKTIHMDVLWTCSDSAIVKSMFAFDKQGKFYQDITERYARAV